MGTACVWVTVTSPTAQHHTPLITTPTPLTCAKGQVVQLQGNTHWVVLVQRQQQLAYLQRSTVAATAAQSLMWPADRQTDGREERGEERGERCCVATCE